VTKRRQREGRESTGRTMSRAMCDTAEEEKKRFKIELERNKAARIRENVREIAKANKRLSILSKWKPH